MPTPRLVSLVTLSPRDEQYSLSLVDHDPRFRNSIHPDDAMYLFFRNNQDPALSTHPTQRYFESGRDMLLQLQDTLRLIDRPLAEVRSFLDFASGHGRLTRFLTSELHPSKVTVSDVVKVAVDFQVGAFQVNGFYSDWDPSDFSIPNRYEMILVASLFSHLPMKTWRLWLRVLYRALEPHGVLIITTHGPTCLPDPDQLGNQDFLFFPTSAETHPGDLYGTTYVTSPFVQQTVLEETGEALLLEKPQGMWNYQDVYVIERTKP